MRDRFYSFTSVKLFTRSALCVLLSFMLLLICGAVTTFAEDDAAATIGDTEYATLQDAIDAAVDGDEITLMKDTTAFVTISNKSIAINLNGYTLSADSVGNIKRALQVDDLAEITVENGYISGGMTQQFDDPAVIYVKSASAVFDVVHIKDNTGKVFRAENGMVEFNDCTLADNNNSSKASGASVVSVYGSNTSVVVNNSVFSDNDMGTGYVIYNNGNTVTLNGCDIVGNKSSSTVYLVSDGTLSLNDTTIKNNIGTSETGGVRINKGYFYMTDSAVYQNECTGSSYGNDFYVIYNWLTGGEIPLPKDMKDHGVALDNYELVAPRTGEIMTKPVSKANGGQQQLSVDPKDTEGGLAEYNGQIFDSIVDAVAAMNGQPGTVKILRDAAIAQTIAGFDGLVIDLDGHTMTGKNNKSSALRINGGTVTVKNGAFENCKAITGGALCLNECNGTVENVRFENNNGNPLRLYHNAPIKRDVTDPTPCTFTVKDCKFINNGLDSTSGTAYAMSLVGGSLEMSGCVFDGNYQAMRIANSGILTNAPKTNVSDCDFTNHKGTVIDVYSSQNSDAVFDNCRITDNNMSVRDSKNIYIINLECVDHFSGSPRLTGGDVTFKDCIITGNNGSESTVYADAGRKTLDNCLLSNNDAEKAGAIEASPMCHLTVKDSVIKDNHASGEGTDKSSGGILTDSSEYINISMGMSGGVLLIGLNPQSMGYYATVLDVNGGAVYNNTNDNPNGARDMYIEDGDGLVNRPFYEEMNDGDHDFSTYEHHDNDVIIEKNGGAISTVFLDPIKGSDDNSGANDINAVATWERAVILLKNYDADAIQVMNTVVFEESNDEEIVVNLGGKSVIRYRELKDPLFAIKSGKVAIADTVVDGDRRRVDSALINVNRGAELTLSDGAILKNSGEEFTGVVSPKDRILRTGISEKGGAVFASGTVNMEEGSVIENNYARAGGGIYLEGGTFNMSGGVIRNNMAEWVEIIDGNPDSDNQDTDEEDVYYMLASSSYGGGVAIMNGSSMIMSGGTIENNKSAKSGGGIALGGNSETVTDCDMSTFVMKNGTITGNETRGAGGGLNIQCNTKAEIISGYITNNRALSHNTAFAGGGIYVNGYHPGLEESLNLKSGILEIHDLEIADNTAELEGGAIGWCAAGSGGLGIVQGIAIHDNKANGEYGSDVYFSNKMWIHEGFGTDGLIRGSWKELDELPEENYMSDFMANGASYNWKDENGNPVSSDRLAHNKHKLYLKTDATESDKDVKESVAMTKVHITGNYSASNGGGIGSNGSVSLRSTPNEVLDEKEEPKEEEEVKDAYEEKDEEVDAAKAEEKSRVKGANTGDDTDLMLLMAILIISAASTLTIFIRRRRAGR